MRLPYGIEDFVYRSHLRLHGRTGLAGGKWRGGCKGVRGLRQMGGRVTGFEAQK